ncbi:MAG: hypothetical protein R3323_02410 [Wenzhouxiangellaceae bacterium]|nr:hypothetical protein [Wenzhouxiangellaceae bacterium]
MCAAVLAVSGCTDHSGIPEERASARPPEAVERAEDVERQVREAAEAQKRRIEEAGGG